MVVTSHRQLGRKVVCGRKLSHLTDTDQGGGEGEPAVLSQLYPCAYRVIKLQVINILKRRNASRLNT